MPEAPHVAPPTAAHHVRTLQSAILKESAGSGGADDLVFAINAVIATVYAEGFSAGRVHQTDAHYSAVAFAKDRDRQRQAATARAEPSDS